MDKNGRKLKWVEDVEKQKKELEEFELLGEFERNTILNECELHE